MTDDEKAKEERDAAEEAKRVSAARTVAVTAAIASAVIVIVVLVLMACCGRPRAITLLQLLLALAFSTALIAGARALDGPIRLGGRRRETLASSSAAASILLWLGSFAAIEAALLVVDVVDRWESSRPACSVDAGERLKAILTISDAGGDQTLTAIECDGTAKHGRQAKSQLQNGQDAGDSGSDNGGNER